MEGRSWMVGPLLAISYPYCDCYIRPLQIKWEFQLMSYWRQDQSSRPMVKWGEVTPGWRKKRERLQPVGWSILARSKVELQGIYRKVLASNKFRTACIATTSRLQYSWTLTELSLSLSLSLSFMRLPADSNKQVNTSNIQLYYLRSELAKAGVVGGVKLSCQTVIARRSACTSFLTFFGSFVAAAFPILFS